MQNNRHLLDLQCIKCVEYFFAQVLCVSIYMCILQMSGLDKTKNNWNKIDDFNWLSANEPSPNWKVIEESNRVKSWDETSLHT